MASEPMTNDLSRERLFHAADLCRRVNRPGFGVLLEECAVELDRLRASLSTVEKERDGLREHLRRIVDTAQYADFSATSERVFSELDVFLGEARKALETP